MKRIRLKKMVAEIGVLDYFIFCVFAFFCFFSFQQGDILHTGGSSISYLNGHIWDFYDWNSKYLTLDAYMPSTYIIFAIWNVPLKLFGLMSEPTMTVPTGVLMWYKLLPTALYFLSGYLIYKICIFQGLSRNKAKIAMYVFITCPIGFFSQFLFGQYDIFTVVFMLLGYYYYLKNNNALFVIFFGIAITFKYFALLYFVPLLLFRCKNVFKAVLALAFVGLPFAFETLFYYHSAAFREGVFGFEATSYIFNASIDIGPYRISFVVVFWVLVCLYAYLKASPKHIFIDSIFIINIVSFIVFGLSMWHPQWLLLAVPFMSLGIIYNKRSDLLLLLELLLMCLYCVFTVNMWPDHVDQQLLNLGMLHYLIKDPISAELNIRSIYIIKDISLIMSFFTACLLALTILKIPQYNYTEENDIDFDKKVGYIRARFILGLLFFIIPAMLCFYKSVTAPYLSYSTSDSCAGIIDNSLGKTKISQTITLEYNHIDYINVIFSDNPEENDGYLKMIIVDDESDKTIYMKKIKYKDIRGNEINKINVNRNIKKKHQYDIVFEFNSNEEKPAYSICFNDENAVEPFAVVNGEEQQYNPCIQIWGHNQ